MYGFSKVNEDLFKAHYVRVHNVEINYVCSNIRAKYYTCLKFRNCVSLFFLFMEIDDLCKITKPSLFPLSDRHMQQSYWLKISSEL